LLYQAPEQALGNSYGKPADIWAIGFIIYELVTGKHPLWEKEKDTRRSYKIKLQEVLSFEINEE